MVYMAGNQDHLTEIIKRIRPWSEACLFHLRIREKFMTMWHSMFGLLVMTPLMAALDSHSGNGTWTGFFLGILSGILISVLNAVLMLIA